MGHIKDVTTHLGEPLEAVLAVARVDGVDGQTQPDLLGLRLTQPQLAVLQEKAAEELKYKLMSPRFGRDRSETCTVLTAGSAVAPAPASRG